MKPALIEINNKLLESGMDQIEIDHLMARFLEEEAFAYVGAVGDVIKRNIPIVREEIIH